MHRKAHTLIALSGALPALMFAGSASAATFSGTVVHKNARAHSFVVALRGGGLRAIHAAHAPALGRHVTVRARLLANGTWAVQQVQLGRKTGHVHIRGTVTFVDARRHMFVVSARGVSLLVHLSRSKVHAAADPTVADGDVVNVVGTLDGDSVDATNVQQGGQDQNGVDLEGTIQAIDTTAGTLTISADDSEESGATLTVDVPASFDITLFSVGQSVELIASPNPDGTYTLEQSSDDSGARHADNPGEDQGDNHGDQHASAEQVCAAQESDPNFPATHNGETFGQFYNAQDPTNLDDALGQCIDSQAQQDGQGSGGGDGGNSGGSGGSGGSGDAGGSGGSGGSGD